jgi:hypothetical protein
MKDGAIYIGVELGFMVACIAFGIGVWGRLIGVFSWLIELGNPYLWAAGLMFVLNIGHYMWGLFYADDDISDIPTRGLMTSYFDYYRISIRIFAFLTIGPSMHLRRAIELSKADSAEDDA